MDIDPKHKNRHPPELSRTKKELYSLARRLDRAVQQEMAGRLRRDDHGAGVIVVIERRAFARAALCTLVESLLGDIAVLALRGPEDLSVEPAAPKPMTVLMSIGARGILDAEVSEDLAAVRAAVPYAALIVAGDLNHADQWAGAVRQGVDAYIPSDSDPALLVQAIRLANYRWLARHDVVADGAGPDEKPSFARSLAPAWGAPVQEPPRPVPPRRIATRARVQLTQREQEVIACLSRGMQNKLIAHELSLCESTVKVHVRSILKKLNLSSRTQAALFARDVGLVPPCAPDAMG